VHAKKISKRYEGNSDYMDNLKLIINEFLVKRALKLPTPCIPED
jgi:hypothetical protein